MKSTTTKLEISDTINGVKISHTDEEIRCEVGKNIQAARRTLRNFLSAEKVAKKLKISRAALAQIERGRNNVSAVMLWKLSCVLGCRVEEFFPKVPQGFQLSQRDILDVAKKDENAVRWAKDLFGEPAP